MTSGPSDQRRLRLFLVAGEHSGDALGAKLMAALNRARPSGFIYGGLGGEGMAREGLASLYPMADVAVMGPVSIIARLPRLVARVYQIVDAALAFKPDAVVIIDAPEFTHPIAKRIRKRAPAIPIIDYVSPSVWAWRPGRARKMRPYVDHLLALLPFEPEAHQRLGGPPCTYVGHPLIERAAEWQALDAAPLQTRLALDPDRPVVVLLPGSRSTEVGRLMAPFGGTIDRMRAQGENPHVIIPVVAHLREQVEQAASNWSVRPHFVDGDDDKHRAFKLARAALAASGTVTLELALMGVPMVVGYKVDKLSAPVLRRLIKAQSIILANLIVGKNAFPEFIQERCEPQFLAPALTDLLRDTPERAAQVAALAGIAEKMHLAEGKPSAAAAEIVLRYASPTLR